MGIRDLLASTLRKASLGNPWEVQNGKSSKDKCEMVNPWEVSSVKCKKSSSTKTKAKLVEKCVPNPWDLGCVKMKVLKTSAKRFKLSNPWE